MGLGLTPGVAGPADLVGGCLAVQQKHHARYTVTPDVGTQGQHIVARLFARSNVSIDKMQGHTLEATLVTLLLLGIHQPAVLAHIGTHSVYGQFRLFCAGQGLAKTFIQASAKVCHRGGEVQQCGGVTGHDTLQGRQAQVFTARLVGGNKQQPQAFHRQVLAQTAVAVCFVFAAQGCQPQRASGAQGHTAEVAKTSHHALG